jgi:hypothetical protein
VRGEPHQYESPAMQLEVLWREKTCVVVVKAVGKIAKVMKWN